jgi:hypothetical protein
MSMVKATITKGNTMEDIDNLDIDLQPFDIAPFLMFINLSDSLFREDAPSSVHGLEAWHAHGLFILWNL